MTHNKKGISRSYLRNLAAIFTLVFVFLVGCQGESILQAILPGETIRPMLTTTPESVNQVEEVSTPTPTTPGNLTLVVWMPAQFSPYEENEAAALMTRHLKDFMEDYPHVNLDIRVKAASGTGGMLDTLTSASQVAPEALPALVLLSRNDLEQAAQLGLVQPIEEVSTLIDEEDWYGFARSMGIVQGTAYGLPFAADVLGLLYRDASLTSNQPTWDEVNSQLGSLVFPAADVNILTTLALYLSAGGLVQDPQGQPFIDVEALTSALQAYSSGLNSGLISPALLDIQTDDQAWEDFQTTEAQGLISWTSRLHQSGASLKLAALPSLGNAPATLARGWSWCLVSKDSISQTYAGLLAEHLVDPDFLLEWTPLSGFLPVRPSSITTWENPLLKETINQMLLSAQLRPSPNQASAFNLVIKTAIQEVLSGVSLPEESARKAAEHLEVVE